MGIVESLLVLLMYLAVGIVVFLLVLLALRGFFLWFFRINDLIALLEQIAGKSPAPKP